MSIGITGTRNVMLGLQIQVFEIRSDVLKQYRVQTLMSTIRRLYILYFYSNAY